MKNILRFDRMSRAIYLFVTLVVAITIAGCGSGTPLAGGGPKTPYNPKNPAGVGPAAVGLSSTGSAVAAGDLGASGNYAILSKTGISNVTGSSITGNIAVSPAAASYLTGFALTAPTDHSTSFAVVGGGQVYAADYANPTPTNLTTAVGSMQTAYTDAASRNPPDFNEFKTGNIGGQTLPPGLYTWTSSVTIPLDVTISGGANDIWIFQTTGDVTMAAAKNIILAGGAKAKNIFWQVAGQVTIGTSAHFEGVILCKTGINLQTLASINGRLLSQTMVTLDNNTVVQPQ